MEYVALFFKILFFTLGIPVLCGLVVGVCDVIVNFLMGRGLGRGIILGTSIIGTPIHELGHALMCLIFAHKIDKIVLWQPQSKDGALGYVTHRYNRKNIYHQLGNIFIGLGPVFSGLAVMILCMLIAFPETVSAYADNASSLVSGGDGYLSLLTEGFAIIPAMLEEWSDGGIPVWGRVIAVIFMLCVSLHISLSPADIKGALGGIPVYLLLTLIATVIVSLIGSDAMETVSGALAGFSAATFALFMLVFVFAVLQILLGILIFLIRKLIGLR